MLAPAVVVAWDDKWSRDFQAIADRLTPALPDGATVEHVGSTAVGGLAAKPIIDVDVVVRDRRTVPLAVVALQRLGYMHEGDLGIPGREAFSVLPGLPYHHLYVVVAGSQPHRDHIDLRDYLRTHPKEAERYAAVKQRLAYLLTTDRDEYVRQKSVVVEDLLARSRQG
jgi:GrpB-like predicted nucleotidyltransferase (UPF0157 family)